MESQFLLNDEKIITQSDGDIIMLTNYRIRYSDMQFGKAHIISMMLKNISSIEVKYRSNTGFLFGSIILFIASVFSLGSNVSEFMPYGIVLGILLVVVYLKTRKHVLSIISHGGKEILFHTKGMKHDSVLKFMSQVEKGIKDD